MWTGCDDGTSTVGAASILQGVIDLMATGDASVGVEVVVYETGVCWDFRG